MIDRRQSVPCGERDNLIAPCIEIGISSNSERTRAALRERCERGLQFGIGTCFGYWRIRRGVFKSVDELRQAIMDYLDNHNGNPKPYVKPYVWTKTAAEILSKVARRNKR